VGSRFHGAQGEAVHHLKGGRGDSPRRDGGHSTSSARHLIVNRQQGFYRFGLARQSHGGFRDHAKRAFRTYKDAGEIISRPVPMWGAGVNHFAVRQHYFQAQNVVGRNPKRQGVGTAGILRHIAADGAGLLAGGIRRIIVTGISDRQR
jgi:hypothetical protein